MYTLVCRLFKQRIVQMKLVSEVRELKSSGDSPSGADIDIARVCEYFYFYKG